LLKLRVTSHSLIILPITNIDLH